MDQVQDSAATPTPAFAPQAHHRDWEQRGGLTGGGAPPVLLLTREQIAGADDTVYSVIEVPQWGGKVRVRSLKSIERDAYDSSLIKGKGNKTRVDVTQARAKLAARGIVDEQGQRMFDPASKQDLHTLGCRNSAALETICREIRRISAMRTEDEEEDGDGEGNETGSA